MRTPAVAIGVKRKKPRGEHDTLGSGWSRRRLHRRAMGQRLSWVEPKLCELGLATLWETLSPPAVFSPAVCDSRSTNRLK